MYYVYTLKCVDKHLYTGCTENIEERFNRHNSGHVPATAGRLPVELITYTVFKNKYKAFEFEKYLKSGSGRAFMNKHLIDDNI
ncbi:MAG: GIY-YIG nuclease family protein [Patescibacteria group bacterium]|nr:GIY-YIG nuclease family protein [Patescibacteria group bacterium]